jgi:hypothetical protein
LEPFPPPALPPSPEYPLTAEFPAFRYTLISPPPPLWNLIAGSVLAPDPTNPLTFNTFSREEAYALSPYISHFACKCCQFPLALAVIFLTVCLRLLYDIGFPSVGTAPFSGISAIPPPAPL